MPTGQLRPWDDLMRRVLHRSWGTRPWSEAKVALPCKLVLSLSRNGNGLLNVRCECMAGTVNKRPGRYYNYDMLGTRLTFAQARELWEAHKLIRDIEGEDHAGDAGQTA